MSSQHVKLKVRDWVRATCGYATFVISMKRMGSVSCLARQNILSIVPCDINDLWASEMVPKSKLGTLARLESGTFRLWSECVSTTPLLGLHFRKILVISEARLEGQAWGLFSYLLLFIAVRLFIWQSSKKRLPEIGETE